MNKLMEMLITVLSVKMIGIAVIAVCLIFIMRAVYGWAWCPKDSVPLEYIPGVEHLADSYSLTPFMRKGQLLFEEQKIDRSGGGGNWRYGLGRLVRDAHGQLAAETPPYDSLKPLFPSFGKYDFSAAPELKFSGSIDPHDRLVYSYKFHQDHGLVLYDFAGVKPPLAMEFFSLSELRREAAERRRSFSIEPKLRERLRKAGFILPAEVPPPRWNREPWTDVSHEEAQRDMEQGNWGRIIWRNFRAIRHQNKEEKAYNKILAAHLDTLQRQYEEAIERFVADNSDVAYTIETYYIPDYHLNNSKYETRKYVVLHERGFAFELTSRMKLPELPAAGTPLPKWDKKRSKIFIRQTGYRRDWQFWPIAMIPWWKVSTDYYYKLTIDAKAYCIVSGSRQQLLNAEHVNGKIYFSLIDKAGLASLYVYDKKTKRATNMNNKFIYSGANR
jgi:hypothetical protein